jgi:hypothetical protein
LALEDELPIEQIPAEPSLDIHSRGTACNSILGLHEEDPSETHPTSTSSHETDGRMGQAQDGSSQNIDEADTKPAFLTTIMYGVMLRECVERDGTPSPTSTMLRGQRQGLGLQSAVVPMKRVPVRR